jgi:uncharacterized protein (DUF302 family)
MRAFLLALALVLAATASTAELAPREGWVVLPTRKDHATLLADLAQAVKDNGMGVVTQAGPTATARSRGITIPENRVVGVFNNEFAVRILSLSTAAMIEAPIRFYLTENADGTAMLSYKTPSLVFSPYLSEVGPALEEIASALDLRFDAIARQAIR